MKSLDFNQTVRSLKILMLKLSKGEPIDLIPIVTSIFKKNPPVLSCKIGELVDKNGSGAVIEYAEHKFCVAANRKYGVIDHYIKTKPKTWTLDTTMYFDSGSASAHPNFVISQNRHGGVWQQSSKDRTATYLKDFNGEYIRSYQTGSLARRSIITPKGNISLGI